MHALVRCYGIELCAVISKINRRAVRKGYVGKLIARVAVFYRSAAGICYARKLAAAIFKAYCLAVGIVQAHNARVIIVFDCNRVAVRIENTNKRAGFVKAAD